MKALLCLAPLAILPLLPIAQEPDADESEIDRQMEVVEDAIGKLRRSLRDEAKNEESLTAVATIEAAVLKSKLLTPKMAAAVPEAEREAFVRAYRKELCAMLRDLLELEDALLDRDYERAAPIFKQVRQLEEPAHERFTADEE